MRLAWWLDQIRQRPRNFRRPAAFARRASRCRLAEVERLEDRTQLSAMTYAATDLPLQVPPDGPDSTGMTTSPQQRLTIRLHRRLRAEPRRLWGNSGPLSRCLDSTMNRASGSGKLR